MMHIIVGLFFIALGIWGVFDEWYYVVDFTKGISVVFLILAGAVSLLAGVVGPLKETDKKESTKNKKIDEELVKLYEQMDSQAMDL